MRFALKYLHQHFKAMKTTAKLIVMIVLLSSGTWLMTGTAQAQGGFSVQVFYNELRPYGNWIDTPEYGYVWVPDVAPGFHPYGTSGYWVNSIYGWTWVSYYPWGWAPFHYGRWYFDNWHGWVWVPGTEWGPAWVSWRDCDGYYGWAPLAPGFRFSMSYYTDIYLPPDYWVFVPGRYFGDRHQDHHYMGRRDDDRLYQRSHIIGRTVMSNDRNARYFKGPEVSEVRKATGRNFKPLEARKDETLERMVRSERKNINRQPIESQVKATKNQRSENVGTRRELPSQQALHRYSNPLKEYNREPVTERQKPVPARSADQKQRREKPAESSQHAERIRH
jgi:hypothetical protein